MMERPAEELTNYCNTIYHVAILLPGIELVGTQNRGTTKPVAGTFFYILLALSDQERYGLDIAQEVERRTRGDIVLGPGTLYNAVKKMLDQGLIEDYTDKVRQRAEDDPRRRYYRITQDGREVLAAEAGRLETLVKAARAKKVLT